ncbi:MAG: tetratricopeptide repeat protein [Candidatus Caenarcaniphilales bacterium]|nr:tetratricopeptide repeat protein [Candidatus Caenarcaniphilales bacterium]
MLINKKTKIFFVFFQFLLWLGVPAHSKDSNPLEEMIKACESGNADACIVMGTLYHQGRGVKQDPLKELYFYEQACNHNHAIGCDYVGVLYELGKGVEPDAHKAFLLYEKSCDLGGAAGCYDLAGMYDQGRGGVAQDPVKAQDLFTKAQKLGAQVQTAPESGTGLDKH